MAVPDEVRASKRTRAPFGPAHALTPAEQAQVAHLEGQLFGEHALVVPVGDPGHDSVVDESPGSLLDESFFRAEKSTDLEEVSRVDISLDVRVFVR